MITRYRLVWLVPDPYTGGRVTLGALVERGSTVSFVPADLRGFEHLGPAARALAAGVAAELERVPAFDELPAGVGPHVIAGEAIAVPAAVLEPKTWLVDRILCAA